MISSMAEWMPSKALIIIFLCPQCVLRIHFIEAQELLRKDKFLGGLVKGKSDPYGVIKIGTDLFQSKVIHDTVNPKWNEVYEVSLIGCCTESLLTRLESNIVHLFFVLL